MGLLHFTVLVGDHFPIDMLAEEHCFPETRQDAIKLLEGGPRKINLVRSQRSLEPQPNFQSWKDSRCRVERVSYEPYGTY
jgi:hypothetical protein